MFKFFIYLLVFYVIFRYIFGTLFKINFYQFNQYHKPQNNKKPEGTITITGKEKSSLSNKKSDDGEYVDFEEIK